MIGGVQEESIVLRRRAGDAAAVEHAQLESQLKLQRAWYVWVLALFGEDTLGMPTVLVEEVGDEAGDEMGEGLEMGWDVGVDVGVNGGAEVGVDVGVDDGEPAAPGGPVPAPPAPPPAAAPVPPPSAPAPIISASIGALPAPDLPTVPTAIAPSATAPSLPTPPIGQERSSPAEAHAAPSAVGSAPAKPRALDSAQAYEAHLLFRSLDRACKGRIQRSELKQGLVLINEGVTKRLPW